MRLIGFILVIMPFFVFGQGGPSLNPAIKPYQYVRDLSEVDGSEIHLRNFKIRGAA